MTYKGFYDKVNRQMEYISKGGIKMAVKATNRKPLKGNDRSHALNTSKRARKLNLQVHRLEDGTKVRLTAREKRTLRKEEKAA